ncbi:hypothetical protein EK904_004817 [Melospiza melodia maxima]|nr:hypothetical protein EK904_004817 [Melospiza melodia maxima]
MRLSEVSLGMPLMLVLVLLLVIVPFHEFIGALLLFPCAADVPAWLKSLRLHKYAALFSQMTYEEMMALTECQLEAQNVTKGARHKIVISIQKLKERQNLLKSLEGAFTEIQKKRLLSWKQQNLWFANPGGSNSMPSRSHSSVQRTRSLPVHTSPQTMLMFQQPEFQVPVTEPDINNRLESLCLSMTEHALSGLWGRLSLLSRFAAFGCGLTRPAQIGTELIK